MALKLKNQFFFASFSILCFIGLGIFNSFSRLILRAFFGSFLQGILIILPLFQAVFLGNIFQVFPFQRAPPFLASLNPYFEDFFGFPLTYFTLFLERLLKKQFSRPFFRVSILKIFLFCVPSFLGL